MKKIGILGSGDVAKTLGMGFIKHGYKVKIGTRDTSKLKDWYTKAGSEGSVCDFNDAAKFGDIIVLAVKGNAAKSVLDMIDKSYLEGKTIIDVTNPIADSTPLNGVLIYFSNINKSLHEELQEYVPGANFIKAFNSVGNNFMVNPDFHGQIPSMFICGNSENSKNEVKEILKKFGWETEDMGSMEAARAIEPLCMLWCIPGLRENRWNHAFKLLKQ